MSDEQIINILKICLFIIGLIAAVAIGVAVIKQL